MFINAHTVLDDVSSNIFVEQVCIVAIRLKRPCKSRSKEMHIWICPDCSSRCHHHTTSAPLPGLQSTRSLLLPDKSKSKQSFGRRHSRSSHGKSPHGLLSWRNSSKPVLRNGFQCAKHASGPHGTGPRCSGAQHFLIRLKNGQFPLQSVHCTGCTLAPILLVPVSVAPFARRATARSRQVVRSDPLCHQYARIVHQCRQRTVS